LQTANKYTGIIEPVLRGDVYQANLDPIIGSEIGKQRPVVIIQNNTGNKFSPVLIVVPISSTKEITKPLPIMVFVKKGEGGLDEDSYVDCGQIRTLNKEKRFLWKHGSFSQERMYEINLAIRKSISI